MSLTPPTLAPYPRTNDYCRLSWHRRRQPSRRCLHSSVMALGSCCCCLPSGVQPAPTEQTQRSIAWAFGNVQRISAAHKLQKSTLMSQCRRDATGLESYSQIAGSPDRHGVQPRKDGLGTPPFLGFFYSYTLRRHPKTLNTNTTPSMHLFWGTLGPGSVMPNFGVFLEPLFGQEPPKNPPSWPGRGGS